MKPWMKKLYILLPQILYVAIPIIYFYLALVIPILEDDSNYSDVSLASEIFRNAGIPVAIVFVVFAVLYAVTSRFYVKESDTVFPCLRNCLIVTAASLPCQLILVFGMSFLFFAGSAALSLMVTYGLIPFYLLTPVVTAILLPINFILCIPSFLHALFGIFRAREENLLTKRQFVLLIIFVVDPMIRFITVMIAMILVRKKEKLAEMPKIPMLSAN
jgi:hypothetical protein